MAAPAGTCRQTAFRESGPRVRIMIAKGSMRGGKLAGKGELDGWTERAELDGRAPSEALRASSAASASSMRCALPQQQKLRQTLRPKLWAPLPYSMPTTVARSGTVTSASAVVMKVPCAMVFASPLYW